MATSAAIPHVAQPWRLNKLRRRERSGCCRALFKSNGSSEHGNGHQQHQQHQQQQRQAGGGGGGGGGGEQHASIQHPLFPEADREAAVYAPVQTQRGIPMFRPVIPERPCPQCSGTGKVTCGDCRGKGRLNYRGAAMLPQGAWPQWCSTCRASGRWCCAACMGTGVKRRPIGFRILHEEDEE